MESKDKRCLTVLHSERPKLFSVLAFLSAGGLNTYKCCFVYRELAQEMFNCIALRKAKMVFSFGLSECRRVKHLQVLLCLQRARTRDV